MWANFNLILTGLIVMSVLVIVEIFEGSIEKVQLLFLVFICLCHDSSRGNTFCLI